MAKTSQPTIIKKYANRRLYHTGTSTYVTLEDLAKMVHDEEDFVVYDAKTGDDITRSVLTQIIFEQEGKEGQQYLLPATFLRQLIRFYGDSLQALVPSYLEFSIENLVRDQQKFREQLSKTFGPAAAFHALEEQVKTNMTMFQDALKLFTPFGSAAGGAQTKPESKPGSDGETAEMTDLRKQMAAMQAKLDAMTKKA